MAGWKPHAEAFRLRERGICKLRAAREELELGSPTGHGWSSSLAFEFRLRQITNLSLGFLTRERGLKTLLRVLSCPENGDKARGASLRITIVAPL